MMASGQVHLWRVELDRPTADPVRLWECLSDDERERAARFPFDQDRRRYIVAHAVLRVLLARYLDVPECRDTFDIGPDGKPSLGSGVDVHFNLARSRGQGLIALAAGTELGVDLEALDHETAIDALIERFFSPLERRALQCLPAQRRRAAFFHVWCQKEAYLKARGDGVVGGLDHFDVVADPEEGAGILADRKDPAATHRWKLLALDAPEGFCAALAWEGDPLGMHQCDWAG